MTTHWRLPRGVDEILPPRAWELEKLRRKVLDVFATWGYEYVEPPVIEYLESLLVGSGEDLDLQTLKVVDQVSGRQLGVRSDMTSQAVRIDAHSRVTEGVQRLCYAGSVVFANPQIAQTSRVPFKAGAELFGSDSLAADAEVIRLMLETMHVAGVRQPVLLLGHMGVYRGLVGALIEQGGLREEDEVELFKAVQRKSEADVRALLPESPEAEMIASLPTMMGAWDDLSYTISALEGAPEATQKALSELQALIDLLADLLGPDNGVDCVRIDVSELSGYGYHNGPVFAVYHPEHGSALAQGGRYDGVGEVFGRARPATGFDVNLKNLIPSVEAEAPVFVPWNGGDEDQARAVSELRSAGEKVVCALTPDEEAPSGARILKKVDGSWRVMPTDKK